jgi:hypothetical protein
MFAEISGFLFLFIIIVLITATSKYGYEIFSELDSESTLQAINENPKKFKTGTILVVIEHLAIVALAVSLFIAFSYYNLILGFMWLSSRAAEGLIQIYNKRSYWSLLKMGNQYSAARGADRNALTNSALAVLKSKNSTVSIAQILFSIGTLAYSILFAFYEVTPAIPVIIGWFGIVASIIYGAGNGVTRIRPNFKALWNLGGLLIWIFELVLGGWLLLSPLLVP